MQCVKAVSEWLQTLSGSMAVLVVNNTFCPGGCSSPQQSWGSPLVRGKPGQGNAYRFGSVVSSNQDVGLRFLPLVTVRCRSDPSAWLEARGP